MAKRKKRATKRGPRSAPPRALTTRRAKLTELHIDPANARKHGKRNLETIRGSLKRFGQVEPLVVQRGTGRVIGGNGRLKVLLADGVTHADVVEVDVDDTTATALAIALNRTAEFAEWDTDILAALAPTLDADLLGDIGFDIGELDKVLERFDAADAGLPDLDSGPAEFEQISLVFTITQAAVARKAIEIAKGRGVFADTGNSNPNGNAAARIFELYVADADG